LIDLSPDATFVREREGKIVFWSRGAESLYGWSKEDALGHRTNDLLQTRFPQPIGEIHQILDEKGRWEGELEHYTKNGTFVTVQSRWLAMRGDGNGYQILESNLDISERKRWEETMRRRTEELEKLMDALPAAVWIAHDRNCTSISGNRPANELLRVKAGTNLAQPASDGVTVVYFRTDGREFRTEELPLHRAATTGRAVRSVEVELRFSDGKRSWLLGSAEPLFDAEGVCRGSVATFLDETERKVAEEHLKNARDELALANDRLELRVTERTQSLEKRRLS
jgi:PAS domain S-box-containing protein